MDSKALLNGVEDLLDGNFEERRRGLRIAIVGGGRGGIAQDEGLRRIGPIAGGIGGAEDGHRLGAEGDGEMERAGVSTDDALRPFEQGHELSEFAVIGNGSRVAAGGFDRGGEFFFPRTVINHTAKIQVLANFLAERAETVGGPAFGTPAAAGAEHDVASDASGSEVGADALAMRVFHLQCDWTDGVGRAGAKGEFAVLIGDMNSFGANAVRVEQGNAEFADGGGRKADAFANAAEEWKQRRFPEALVVDRGLPGLRANFGENGADIGEIAGVDGPDFVGEDAAGDKVGPTRVGEPDNFGERK